MKGLTAKEEEIMGFFWEKGPLFVKEMLAFYNEPKPHFNTLSTIVRGLEDKGFLAHNTYGNTYQYYAIVSEEAFRKSTLKISLVNISITLTLVPYLLWSRKKISLLMISGSSLTK